MMEEDFLAIIKLVSGEELISLVGVCEEDDEIVLILSNPIVLKEYETPLGTIVKIEPWIKTTGESMYFIYIDKVITISEVTDQKLINIYEKYIRQINNIKESKATKSMGYISNIDDFRKDLEKIYKSS
jgi:hypothetical protein